MLRIVEMRLSAEQRTQDPGVEHQESFVIRGTGHKLIQAIPDGRDASYDAQAIKASGFDAPTFEVQGGALYSGGSQLNGFRAQDRELVINMLPVNNETPTSIKTKLGRMSSLSLNNPLLLEVSLMDPHNRIGGTYYSKVYISDITSPILSESREVQLTVKMGGVSFTNSDPIHIDQKFEANYGQSRGYSDVIEGLRSRDGHLRLLTNLYLSQNDLEGMTAPSILSGELSLMFSKEDVGKLKAVEMRNIRGDSIRLVPKENFVKRLTAFEEDLGYVLDISIDGRLRDVAYSNPQKPGQYYWGDDAPFNMYTNVRWPLCMPAKTSLTFAVELTSEPKYNVFAPNHRFEIYPERYGF